MKFSSQRWVTLIGRPPKRWQKPLHRNTHLRIGKHSFNLTTAIHLEYHKVYFSHAVLTDEGWQTKTNKMWW